MSDEPTHATLRARSLSLKKKPPTKTPAPSSLTSFSYRVLRLEDSMCPDRCFFDHDETYIRKRLPLEALEKFALLEVESSPPLPYRDERVNLAASYVLKYLETRDTHDWFHVMIKAVAFESFLEAVKNESRCRCRLLAFSCWCDGGRYEKPEHRQHRHMVAVCSPRGRFESEIWNRVAVAKTDDRPCPNYPCKGSRRIQSVMHLVNTLGYLSQRQSNHVCSSSPRGRKSKKPSENKHFYIFTTLPTHYRLPLATLWDEGLAKLMYQQFFRNISVESVVRHPFSYAKSQWRQKIEDFYGLPRGVVLPVDKRFSPTDRETPHYVHLLNGRKLFFEIRPENQHLDEKAWLEMQVRGGNSFYENVGGEWWFPRKDDQEKLNLVLPRENRIRELELEKEGLKIDSIRLKALIADLEKKIDATTDTTNTTTTDSTNTNATNAGATVTNGNVNIDRVIINNHYK